VGTVLSLNLEPLNLELLNPPDRRLEPRQRSIAEHGIFSVRIKPGRVVVLVDVSAGGTLVEGQQQLRPGAAVDVQMCDVMKEVVVRGRVLRSAVFRLQATDIWYRTAIQFDRRHPWFLERR